MMTLEEPPEKISGPLNDHDWNSKVTGSITHTVSCALDAMCNAMCIKTNKKKKTTFSAFSCAASRLRYNIT